MKLPRWRPECPECGYSLRGLTGDRCPECGEPFPTTQRTFRRWATHRIPWDRRHRTSLLRAYFATVFLIVFCPWKAARGLVIPDGWGRAIRWAIAHTVVAALVTSVMTGRNIGAHWLGSLFDPRSANEMSELLQAPMAWTLPWAIQETWAWWLAFLSPPAVGCVLSYVVPVRHPASRWGGMKWALYTTVVFPVGAIIWAGLLLGFELHRDLGRFFTSRLSDLEHLPPSVYAAVYIVWLAAGLAVNPFQRMRGREIFLGWVAGMGYLWYVLVRYLFPMGALEGLL